MPSRWERVVDWKIFFIYLKADSFPIGIFFLFFFLSSIFHFYLACVFTGWVFFGRWFGAGVSCVAVVSVAGERGVV